MASEMQSVIIGDAAESYVGPRPIGSVSEHLADIAHVKRFDENRMSDCRGLLRHLRFLQKSHRHEQVDMLKTKIDRFFK